MARGNPRIAALMSLSKNRDDISLGRISARCLIGQGTCLGSQKTGSGEHRAHAGSGETLTVLIIPSKAS